jgi:hypothetical protein
MVQQLDSACDTAYSQVIRVVALWGSPIGSALSQETTMLCLFCQPLSPQQSTEVPFSAEAIRVSAMKSPVISSKLLILSDTLPLMTFPQGPV